MTPTIPQRLGDFEILRELGRGGMGVVYEARQLSLNRKVALKVLACGLGLTSRAVERFRREAEAAARLHHTNVVPVYATGECDGVHYYAMELIDGPSLDHVLRQLRQQAAPATPESPAELMATVPHVNGTATPSDGGSGSLTSGGEYFDNVARMIADVADALDHAHKQGVIHRDVKPSNLLLSPEGRLSLNDFGLARMLEEPGVTVTGEFVGTPAYVSPEQITSGRIPLDHRTDVYSLGATLYELLTLRAPFVGERRDQILAQIIQKDPPPPRSLNKQIPRDLETICLKAMEKDPDRRYQSAGEMAADLRRYVQRFAVLARRPGPLERLRKWARRHPGLSAGVGVALLAVIVAGVFAYQAYDADQRRQREAAEAAAKLEAEKRHNALDRALVAATSGDLDAAERAIAEAEGLGASYGQVRMLHGQVALHRGQTQTALEHLEQAVKRLPRSAAAQGMLAAAYAYAGQWDRFYHALEALKSLVPESAEDFLYKGYAEAGHDPERGIQAIDKSLQMRRSDVARLLRAEVLVWRAQNSGKLADALQAVKEADHAKASLPDNPTALWVSLHARLTTAGTYDRGKDHDGQQRLLGEAKADADELKRFTALPDAVVFRWLYFRELGQEGDVLEEMRLAANKFDHAYFAFCCALTLYRRGDFKGSLEILSRSRSLWTDNLRPFVLVQRARKGYPVESASWSGLGE